MNFTDNLVGYYQSYIAQPVKKAYDKFLQSFHNDGTLELLLRK